MGSIPIARSIFGCLTLPDFGHASFVLEAWYNYGYTRP